MSEKDFAYWKEILERSDIQWISYQEDIHVAADRIYVEEEWIRATFKHILSGI